MARKAIIVGLVSDYCGDEWDVREFRHVDDQEWTIAFGWPAGFPRGRGGTGGPRTILTQPLVDHLESVRYANNPIGAANLPLGRAQIKRVRFLLGHNRKSDRADWWIEHAEELKSIESTAFAAKYGLSGSAADLAYGELFGELRGRESSWWSEPEAVEILRNDLPIVDKADQLGRTVKAIWNARWLLGITKQHQKGNRINEQDDSNL